VSDDARKPSAPVAIRISRPQASEDDLLEQELDTITRTGVTLLGAQPRPAGVVLRFEIVLATGTVAMRGEGRVVAFKPNAHQGLGGLTLRFTRLDSKSKALVDKAQALREKRRPSVHPSTPPPPAADTSPAVPPAPATDPTVPVEESGPELPKVPPAPPLPASVPPPPPVAAVAAPEPAPEASPLPPVLDVKEIARARSVPPPLPPRASRRPAPPTAPTPTPPTSPTPVRDGRAPIAPPAERDALLERLRARAKGFDAQDVARILQPRAK
jgi:hypothetical protein